MIIDVVMPKMGESVADGTIVKWHAKAGDRIGKDDIIFEISTDKVDSEIPSPASGILKEILVPEGETISVNTVVARIESGDTEKPKPLKDEQPAGPSKSDTAPADKKMFLSPVVKRMAQEHHIPEKTLLVLKGSGAGGRVTKKDVLKYLEKAGPAETGHPVPADETGGRGIPVDHMRGGTAVSRGESGARRIPMDHVRKQIAAHMVMSKKVAAHVTSMTEADVTGLAGLREKHKTAFRERTGAKLTMTAFFVHAVCRALKDYPLMNSSIADDDIVLKTDINIGVAVGVERGLIVPVIKNADILNVDGIARRLSDLVGRARAFNLSPDDVQGGTFSITNFGTVGNLMGTPIIHQPQVAILGVGAVKKRPVVINDAIAIRPMVYLSLSYDHRIIDGLYGGSFLEKIARLLENYSENMDI